jgi:hypothetical protein
MRARRIIIPHPSSTTTKNPPRQDENVDNAQETVMQPIERPFIEMLPMVVDWRWFRHLDDPTSPFLCLPVTLFSFIELAYKN